MIIPSDVVSRKAHTFRHSEHSTSQQSKTMYFPHVSFSTEMTLTIKFSFLFPMMSIVLYYFHVYNLSEQKTSFFKCPHVILKSSFFFSFPKSTFLLPQCRSSHHVHYQTLSQRVSYIILEVLDTYIHICLGFCRN